MSNDAYVVGLVVSVKEVTDKLKHLVVDIGGAEPVNIVTNAPNVGTRTEGKKVIVAPVGAMVEDTKVEKRSVGGVTSEGMLMDSKGMGWSGGAQGNAVLVPDNLAPGSTPPTTRPRMDDGGPGAAAEPPASNAAAGKKAAKEQAKAKAAAAREARKANKSNKKGPEEEEDGGDAAADAESAL